MRKSSRPHRFTVGRHSAQRVRPLVESSLVPRKPITVVDFGMVMMYLG